jgi:lipopolysaccharide exporter
VSKSLSLGGQVRRGAVWGGLSSFVLRLASFGLGVIIARLVAPSEFGVFAVALTVHAIIVNVSEIGVSAYLIRDDGDPDHTAPTVMTIALVSSSLLALTMVICAPWLAGTLGATGAAGPIRVMSLTVVIAGVSAVPNALLIRAFRQDKRFVAEAMNFIVSSGLVILLAVGGAGAFALAWSRVAGQVASAALLILLAPKRYRPGFRRDKARHLIRFGLPLAGANIIGYSIYNCDYITVGRSLGAVQLGLYTLAFNISGWPSGVLSSIVDSVAMPAFARVRYDRERLPQFLSTAVSTLVAIALPVSALTLALAGPIVSSVYGAQWSGAASALALLALFGAVRVPNELFANVIVALGRPRALFLVQIAWIVCLVPVMIVGVDRWGIAGAAVAHVAVAGGVVLPSYVLILRAAAGVGVRDLIRSVVPVVVGSVLAAVVAHVTAMRMSGHWSGLLAGAAVGALTYLVVTGPWLLRLLRQTRELWGGVEAQSAGEPRTEYELALATS